MVMEGQPLVTPLVPKPRSTGQASETTCAREGMIPAGARLDINDSLLTERRKRSIAFRGLISDHAVQRSAERLYSSLPVAPVHLPSKCMQYICHGHSPQADHIGQDTITNCATG